MSDVNIMGGDADPEALAHPQPLFKMLRDAGPIVDLGAVDAGVGLTSMRDRLAAVGGELAIVTAPGEGTRVIGRIPLGQRLPRAVPPRRTAREF